MKNITVTIDDETHGVARIHAARHGTSVSALVKEYLRTLGQTHSARDPALAPAIGVREMQAVFHSASTGASSATSLAAKSLAAASGPPWQVDGAWVWTPDGRPRQPGALRGGDGTLEDWPAEVLATFDTWDEDDFDRLA